MAGSCAYGDRAEDYLTDVLARKARPRDPRAAAAGQPFFLYLVDLRAARPSTWAPRHAGLFTDTPLPRPPSFDEHDVSDKPAIIRDLPPMSRSADRRRWRSHYRCAAARAAGDRRSGRERGPGPEQAGQLEQTYIVYTSDNGFHMGEHRHDRRARPPPTRRTSGCR